VPDKPPSALLHDPISTAYRLGERDAVDCVPDVRTYGEADFRELVLDQWLGVFLPAGSRTMPTVRTTRPRDVAAL